MGRKSKISNELRIELVKKILKGKETIQNLAKEYDVAKSSLMTWKKKYLELGEKSIMVDEKNKHYTRETRIKAVKSYLNNEITLKKRDNKRIEKIIMDKDGNLKELSKNINLNVSHSNKEKGYFNYKLTIPGAIVKAMELDKDPNVDIRTERDKIIIIPLKYKDYRNCIVEEPEEMVFKEEISEYNQGGKMNNIFTVKVNKGGIGKTFFTVQIGHGLALQGYKVLLITSDSQNNILHYTKSKKEIDKYDLSKGLRHAVLYGDNRDL